MGCHKTRGKREGKSIPNRFHILKDTQIALHKKKYYGSSRKNALEKRRKCKTIVKFLGNNILYFSGLNGLTLTCILN